MKKNKQIPRKFLNIFQTKPKNSTNPKKFPNPKQSPKKFTKRQKPPPSPCFQPLKPFFVFFCNTFLKKFANFCRKSEKLYYNFIVLKICLQSRVCLNALQQAHTPFAASKDGGFAAVSQWQKQAQSHKSKVCFVIWTCHNGKRQGCLSY